MAGRYAVNVRGYREFLHACDHAGKETKREVRGTFREVGEIVKVEAASLFSRIDARSAAGYKTRVRQRGVAVEQSLRRTTGKRPDYGALQMRTALLPALERKTSAVEDKFEEALDRVGLIFET